jgi:hypothetical protein
MLRGTEGTRLASYYLAGADPRTPYASPRQVELEIWPRMPHTWQVWAPVLPEARAAIERIGAFVQSKVEPQAVR